MEPVQSSPCKISLGTPIIVRFGNFYVKAVGRFRNLLIFLIFSTNVFLFPTLLLPCFSKASSSKSLIIMASDTYVHLRVVACSFKNTLLHCNI